MHRLHPKTSKIVKLVHGLHQESPRVVKLEGWLHYGCLSGDHRTPEVIKLVMGLHYGSPRVVKLEIGFHQRCPGSDHRNPRVVKLNFGLHQGCYIKEHEVSQGGKASDGASPPKIQEGEVHDRTHYGSRKECEASVGASP